MSTDLSRSDEGFQTRVAALDTFAAVLPLNRRDMLAGVLTDADVETLRLLFSDTEHIQR
jgi:hypothetical protein